MATVDGIVTGDDFEIPVQLYKKIGLLDEVFSISEGAKVRVTLVSSTGERLIDPILCDRTALGANWVNSFIIVQIPASITKTLVAPVDAILEVQVQDPKRLSWIENIHVYKGSINVIEV